MVVALAVAAAWPLAAQSGLDPSQLLAPLGSSWPTFNGDYSGRRFSTLAHITDANVKALSLAWMYAIPSNGGAPIKSTPLHDRRRAVFLDAGPRLRGRRADGA